MNTKNFNLIFGGQAEQAADDAEFFLFAAIIGLFLMAILLMIQLNSFYQVWIVISLLYFYQPLAFI